MDPSVLLVDDDEAVGRSVGALLGQDGIRATYVASGRAALEALEARPFGAVLTDLRMPGMDGLALLDEIESRWPGLPVVVITAHGTIASAVEALKKGAADFVLKPFDRDEILFVVRKALAASREASPQPPPPPPPATGRALLGDAPAMRAVKQRLVRAALGDATVLLTGETGTGKSLVAREIHALSPRGAAPFVTVQCAALPETLLESELFGYEKGAFTGAACAKPGRVELAEGGTIFLDEVGEMPLSMQGRLLRLLQDREYERLGDPRPRVANVRFIAATNRDLERMVAEGDFRADLYYRLGVVPIRMPSLAERAEDVPLLARHFVKVYGARNGRPQAQFSTAALERLATAPWPGNVRQLQNLVERLVVMADADLLEAAQVEDELDRAAPRRGRDADAEEGLLGRRRSAEREAVAEALRRAGNNRTLAARLLGVSRRTLYNKLAELGGDA